MVATEEEMIASKIPHDKRDYCAHHLLNLHSCHADVFPWLLKCGKEKHDYEVCEYNE